MGGNALSTTKTRRYSKKEYDHVTKEVLFALRKALPGHCLEAVKSFHQKETFGDLDLLVELFPETQDKLSAVLAQLGVNEIVKNGPVWSVGWGDFQVDFLFQSSEDFPMARCYFAYNDLGNFVGRTANRLGLKFGHNGLWYAPWEKGQKQAHVLLTKNPALALYFLGYDPLRHHQGFETLIEVYTYAMSSRFFSAESLDLSKRSYRERVRDRKRTSYQGFLRHLSTEHNGLDALRVDKAKVLLRAQQVFPSFAKALSDAYKKTAQKQQTRSRFNGVLVAKWSGLEGKTLGQLMAKCRQAAEREGGMDRWVSQCTEEQLHQWVKNVARTTN
jgi:hypothetical protein